MTTPIHDLTRRLRALDDETEAARTLKDWLADLSEPQRRAALIEWAVAHDPQTLPGGQCAARDPHDPHLVTDGSLAPFRCCGRD